jgi:hypothetical protein
MIRTVVLSAAAFLAGIAVGFLARGATRAPQPPNHAADLAAIERLHKADVDSTLAQDPAALTLLWSENAIKVDVPGSPVVGVKALRDMYAKVRANYPEFRVLKYAPNITDVQIADGWAIEVGDFAGTFQMSAKEAPISVNDKGARVLRRQADGTWKLAVVGLK